MIASLKVVRISKWNSRYLLLDLFLDGEKYGKIADSSITDIALEPGKHQLYVSTNLGLYRSKTLEFEASEGKQIIVEVGPNVKDSSNLLELFIQNLVFWRSYYAKQVDSIPEMNQDEMKFLKEKRYASSLFRPILVLFLILPILYIWLKGIGYPEFIQLITNSTALLGMILSRFLKVKKSDRVLLDRFPWVYFLIMLMITGEHPVLLILNGMACLFVSLTSGKSVAKDHSALI